MSDTQTVKPLPHHENAHWFFGSAFLLAKDPVGFLLENKHKPIYRLTSRIRKVGIVNDPELIKYILVDNNKNYHKSFGYDALKLLLGYGLLTSEDDFWRKQRRLAQPAFHRQKLAGMTQVMIEASEAYCEVLEKHAGNNVDIAPELMALALEIVGKTLFSSNVSDAIAVVRDNLNFANEAGMERIRNPLSLPIWVPTPKNLKEKSVIRNLDKVVLDLINKRRKEEKGKYNDLLSMLMEAQDEETGDQMTNNQLRDEVMTIFLAGHETTAVAITWCLYLLHQNPHVEEKLLAEFSQQLGDREVALEDLPQLTYTRYVVDESLRLYPPAWLIGRKTVTADVVGGHFVPENNNLLMCSYAIHRDERYWDDPLEFKPERWAPENQKERPKFSYFPFGGGPRLCIGNNFAIMEMQVILATLLRKFKFSLKEGHPVELDPLITLRPKHGMVMKVEKRN